MVSTPFIFGKSEYTKREKRDARTCHTAAGKKDLNDIGKCYAEHGHSLEGCEKQKDPQPFREAEDSERSERLC